MQSLLQQQQQARARFEQSKGGDKGDKGGKRDLMRQASGVGILTPKQTEKSHGKENGNWEIVGVCRVLVSPRMRGSFFGVPRIRM